MLNDAWKNDLAYIAHSAVSKLTHHRVFTAYIMNGLPNTLKKVSSIKNYSTS